MSMVLATALAMYGDENRNLGPDELFDREDGAEALRLAKDVHRSCRKLLPTFLKARAGRRERKKSPKGTSGKEPAGQRDR